MSDILGIVTFGDLYVWGNIMEITTTQENLVEKLNVKIMSNVAASLATQDLTEEEVAANLVLAKKSASRDAVSIANLVFAAFAE